MIYKKLHLTATSFIASVTLIIVGTAPASALTLSGSLSASTSAGGVSVKASATLMAHAVDRANQEIDRRTKALDKLSTRINAMRKVSTDEKANLSAAIQAHVDTMASLKTKIDADTDAATLKADVQSIAKSYRIFALVVPQGAVVAAADRGMTIADEMIAIGAKLQARISAAEASGTDVTAMRTAYADFTTKVADATMQAQAAITEVSSLTPDNGDQTKFQANLTAMKDAKTKIKIAHDDLVAARKDVGTIVKDLKGLHVGVSGSASTTNQK